MTSVAPKRIDILGVPVDCVDMAAAVARVDEFIAQDQVQTILAVNPEKVMKARVDGTLMGSLRNAGLLIPDGIGVVIAAKLLGLGAMQRVPGSELMPALCAHAARRGYSVFLFGASADVNEQACAVLRARYPGLRIAGSQNGYVTDQGMPALIDSINSSGAQILFVALGSPKQELWMDRHRSALKVKVCQGVGGTFDVIAGRVKRAPPLFLKLHLEWLYRLLAQPKRLLRQSALPRFAWHVLRQKILG